VISPAANATDTPQLLQLLHLLMLSPCISYAADTEV
jgi:hypothetical protein